jgi:hypothetical protein
MNEIEKKINDIMKRFATSESKINTTPDIIKKTKQLRQFVENGFRNLDVKEEKEIPFLRLKELQQRIIEDRKKSYKRILGK